MYTKYHYHGYLVLSTAKCIHKLPYLKKGGGHGGLVYDAASPPADKEETDYPKYKYSTGSEMISTTTFLPYLPCTYAHTHPVIRGWHKLILLRRGKTINQIPYVHTLCTYLM